MSNRGFADSYGSRSDAWSNRTFDSSRTRSNFDRSRRNELNRSFDARNNGYQRFNSRSMNSGGFNRPAGGLQRRRP